MQVAQTRRQWRGALVANGLGSVVAGTLVGGALGSIGGLVGAPEAAMTWLLTGAALWLGIVEFGLVPRPRPRILRQTRQEWRTRFGPVRSAALWGFDLGLGLTTRVTFASYWFLVIASVVWANPGWGAALMASYGAGRTALIAAGPFMMRRRSLASLHSAPFAHERTWHLLHGWLMIGVVVLLAATGGTRP